MKKDVFQAIADPTRRAILVLLALRAMTPNALAEHFDATRQSISKHIQVLVESRLVTPAHSGREIYYGVNPKKIQEISDWLLQFEQLFEAKFNQLEVLLKNKKVKK